MFDVKALKADFGKAARQYDDNAHLQRHVRAHCVSIVQAYWPPEDHILDLGCGTGKLGLETEGFGWNITGADMAFGMCEVAEGREDRVVTADAAKLPFKDALFDGVFSSLLLQWTQSPKDVLAEMARVLKPDGVAVFATLVAGTLKELAESFAQVDDAEHVSPFVNSDTIREELANAGFAVLGYEESTVIHYYPDLIGLMRSLKLIGAVNKHERRRRGMMTAPQLARVEEYYSRTYGKNGELPMRWQVLYVLVQRS